MEFCVEITYSNNNKQMVLGWYSGLFDLEDDRA